MLVLIKVSICTNVVFWIVHALCLSLSTCSPWPEVICFLKRMSTCLKHQSYRLCPSCPHKPPTPFRLCPSQSKARELSAGSDPPCVEPGIYPCLQVPGPKGTAVDLKYLGVYWMVGLSSPRTVPVTDRGQLPCLAKQSGSSCYHWTSQYWVNGTPLKPVNRTPDHIHWGPPHYIFTQDTPCFCSSSGPMQQCPRMLSMAEK